jgi:hypothetical protein
MPILQVFHTREKCLLIAAVINVTTSRKKCRSGVLNVRCVKAYALLRTLDFTCSSLISNVLIPALNV